MMSQSCSKFRLFNILLLFCVISGIVFLSYFQDSLGSLLTRNSPLFLTSSGNITSSSQMTINTTATQSIKSWPTSFRSAVVPSGRFPVPNSTVVIKTIGSTASTNQHPKDPKGGGGEGLFTGGPGQPLEAEGKVVKPRAKATAPWTRDETVTECPLVPPKLVGPLATYKEAPNWTEIVRLNPGLEPGGHFHPECRARHRVAIIIPYRNREQHLRLVLHNLHPILIRQQLDYFVLVVELAEPTVFNRGMLMNIGAVEALGLWDVQCFIFHDVDLVPENDRNLYTCPEMPRHMSSSIDKFGYKLPYNSLLGGVTAMKREHLYKINGYSNKYFGWGGEDDDLSSRVRGSGLKITRYPMNIARYRMIKHDRDKKNDPNPQRFQLLKNFKSRQTKDGLSSLQYEVQKVEFRPGYTWILVSIDKDKIMKS